MEASIELCAGCSARLHDVVKYCPFCGAEQSVPMQGNFDGPLIDATAHDASATPSLDTPLADSPATEDELSTQTTLETKPPIDAELIKPKGPVVQDNAQKLEAEIVVDTGGADSKTAEHQSPPKPPQSKMGMVLIFGLVVLVGTYLSTRPSKKDATCEQALSQAASLLAGGDAVSARSQTVLAKASCSGEARTKAGELQSAADKVLAAQAQCERSFRRIGSLIAERRLQSARNAFDQLDTACVESSPGKALRSQIELGQGAAIAAEAEVRKQMVDGDMKAARAAFDEIGTHNREHPDLAALRQEMAANQKLSDNAPSANAAMASGTIVQPVAKEPSQSVVPRDTSAASRPQPSTMAVAASTPSSAQAEMAQSFLRDAEVAMNQLKFDSAKTYVESARRIDPGNAQAATLARRIKERELQYLKEETSIK